MKIEITHGELKLTPENQAEMCQLMNCRIGFPLSGTFHRKNLNEFGNLESMTIFTKSNDD